MRCVVFNGTGGNEVVSIESREDPQPSKFEVLIATEYAGVNPADVLQREGRHPVPAGSPPEIPGLEVAGTVIATGEAVTAVATGDRVFGLVGGGGLADRVIAHERELVRVPDVLDEAAAASVPQAFITAFDALHQAGVAPGGLVLVNGASGGVGIAAVQLAVALGARVVANVRSAASRERIAELGATVLGAPEVFEHVRELGGADAILELVGATHIADNVAALALRGTIVVVAAKPGDEVTLALRDLMGRRAHILGTSLRQRPLEQKAVLVQQFAREAVPWFAERRLVTIVDRVFELSEVTDAFEYVRQPGKLGKVLLRTTAA
ncbi:MAG TPA: zinc-binding dehydrogenase [Solirubrobacteraceae bacterium]